MNTRSKTLWDPKYAAVGALTIGLAVFILDYLPGIILKRFNKATGPGPIPEPQSVKAPGYSSEPGPMHVTHPYDHSTH